MGIFSNIHSIFETTTRGIDVICEKANDGLDVFAHYVTNTCSEITYEQDKQSAKICKKLGINVKQGQSAYMALVAHNERRRKQILEELNKIKEEEDNNLS